MAPGYLRANGAAAPQWRSRYDLPDAAHAVMSTFSNAVKVFLTFVLRAACRFYIVTAPIVWKRSLWTSKAAMQNYRRSYS